jgi:O-antigen biosynthesis protein
LRHVLDAEAGTRGTRRAVVDWHDFLGDPRRTLERLGEQLDVIWPRWSDGALAEVDEFVSADMRRQRASDSDLQVHPAVNHLVREAYAAIRELVENPASEKSERTLADIRERFGGAAAIFGHAMLELEEGNRRAQSTGVALRNEYTAQLAAAREEFARQISEASTHVAEASTQLADVRGEFARQLAETREEFARQLAEGRGEFARQLAEGRSECRRLVDEANRDVARAEDAIVQLARRYEPRSASAPKRRFRDYLRPRRKDRKELTAICNSGFFDPEFYLNSNPDVRGSGLDAACHYLVYGGREGRDPGPFFSTQQYLARFPDVAASGVNALVHYEMYGRHEMRKVPLSTP